MGCLFFFLFQKDFELFDENYGYEIAWRWLYSKQRWRIFVLDGSFSGSTVFSNILSFTNFPKKNNAEYNGNRKNE